MDTTIKIKTPFMKRYLMTFLFFVCIKMIGQNEHLDNNFSTNTIGNYQNNTGVDYYTGKLNANIPIYQYKGNEIDLPISINYTTMGIKVDQLAGNVGLGWNLNVGGRIDRSINGNADISLTTNFKEIAGSPDLYEMNVSGLKEYFKIQAIYHPAEALLNPSIKVALRINVSDEWVVTSTVDGTKYYFGANNIQEKSTTSSVDNPTTPNTVTINSWLLTKIVSKNNLDEYRFVYENFEQQNFINIYGKGFRGVGNSLSNTVSKFKTNMQMLKEIYHNNEKIISFNYTDREDLQYVSSNSTGNALSEILFYHYKSDNPYKKVGFTYSYFGNPNVTSIPNTDNVSKRLKLDTINFYGFENSVAFVGDTYHFEYQNPEQLPSVYSFARDYLGLYNGKDSNILNNLYNNLNEFEIPQRDYNYNKSLIGTLTKIVYPTKGYEVFGFERNTYANSTDFTDGFRIKSISNYISDTLYLGKKEFIYTSAHKFRGYKSLYSYPWGYDYPTPLFYHNVKEYNYSSVNVANGYIEYKFMSEDMGNHPYSEELNPDSWDSDYPYYGINNGFYYRNFVSAPSLNNDKIKEKNIYDNANHLLLKEKYKFDELGYQVFQLDGGVDNSDGGYVENWQNILVNSGFHYLQKKETFSYPTTGFEIYQHTDYEYAQAGPYNELMLPSNSFTESGNKSSYTYTSFTSGKILPALIQNYDTGNLVSTNMFVYSNYGCTTALFSKGDAVDETTAKYLYDTDGNRVETQLFTPGVLTPSSYESVLYGYSNRFPVAKLSGVKYSDIVAIAGRIQAIKDASNVVVSPANEENMRFQLKKLRDDFPNALITTYTYNPVYGVTSMTDAKGYTVYYEYDAFGRLHYTKEKDANGNFIILSENQFHTRAQ